MSRAAFLMLMAAAEKQFKEAIEAEDSDAIKSALDDMKRLHKAYYGYDVFRSTASSGAQAA